MTETIRDSVGRIIGYIDTDSSGNKTVKAFGGKILGYYDKYSNTTRQFGGRVIARGDCVGLLFNGNY